jgi:ribokinase
MGAGRVVSLGSINVDVELRGSAWPAFGGSSQVTSSSPAGGGKAANVAYVARRLGAEARLIGHVGDDDLARVALRALATAGVDLRGVKVVEGSPTGLAVVLVRPDGEKAIIAANNANDAWTEEDAAAAASHLDQVDGKTVLVVDVDVPVHVVERLAAHARARGIPVVLDPSPPEQVGATLLRLADYVTPDHSEAEQLTDIAVSSPEAAFRAGEALRARGVGTALVKLERGGCVAVGAGLHVHVPSVPVEPVDSTGAGDAFAAGLAVALAESSSVLDAVHFAVAAATLKVQSYGAQAWQPTRQDVEALVQRRPPDVVLDKE